MLQTDQLKFAYTGGDTFSFPDISCERGAHWLLLGQSGSGKTTFLHLLGGLLSPKSGAIRLEGTDMAQLSGPALDRFRGRHIGIIFQKAHFVNALTVGENLALAQELAGVPVDNGRIAKLLDRLNVGQKIHRKPDRLSVGEQQRVAIARALVNSPELILADEPTSALDDENCEQVLHLLTEQAASVKATLLIVTHDGRLKDKIPNQIRLDS
ncbi:ABC transporter ATP-binding protein [Flavilitoribacter nigricans]|uniref:ABC transporter ATP-binding protein n=1 Tax=Flavilitoribacter nigricans (strain ATCC 23147 / DSM 23189 / NBRC 102662 / NCIMB 1420 / SS-2) TaxID=1122177 RepID=A0A2D0N2F4_FLAN2|nr:ATP-binding cassette domain-containing protein [Flavilitoribacter nigricans]PHN02309.1 ABC transporter ATP-binding protein [Flavilitoribacter nigricans DSM 23189 = NBRC 102662]